MSFREPVRAADEPGGAVDFPPVENGLDYLLSVIELLAREQDEVTPRQLKYAVLHLQAATEVLLKYRLYLEHWTLVLQNLDVAKANKNKKMTRAFFSGGDFISCTPQETVERLRSIIGLDISDDEQKQILDLAKSRNALQHYGMTDTDGTIESRTAEVLDFLVRFLDDCLLPELDPADRERVIDDMELIRFGLTKIRSYIARRMERLKDQLAQDKERTLQCPDCRQWALLAGDPTSCLFCPATTHSQLTAWNYASAILRLPWRSPPPTNDLFSQPSSPPVDPCPDCGADTLVRGAVTAAAPERPTNFCFNCATAFTDLCEICSQPFRAVDEQSTCGNCLSLGSGD
ncbi:MULTISPECIES: hypothetical protein [unclassified Streptomyces]|uniref:hypothetical protein n=1 Tax=unclassified Streptomyces TaxID=2593676 RepID=UPI000712DA22|nr:MULTISPECIES: hypothetical protein [unclassified Streptomyces]KQX26816.1 hypothetical protein ASD29_30855 [Streptomyces sp. Root1295]